MHGMHDDINAMHACMMAHIIRSCTRTCTHVFAENAAAIVRTRRIVHTTRASVWREMMGAASTHSLYV